MLIKNFILFLFVLFWVNSLLAEESYNITNYGATPNDDIKDTKGIQKAIDACNEKGGGKVYIPSGIFITGALELKSNVHFYLEQGALLQASGEKTDFILGNGQSVNNLLNAKNCEGITINGYGTIRGTGAEGFGIPREKTGYSPGFRYFMLQFDHCKNVNINNLKFENSEMFAISLHRCEDVVIDGVTIKNNYYRANTDGIDPALCKNVRISNCNIAAGDDGICFKKGGENIVVTNCIITTPASGIKFGTNTDGIFKNIRVNNCVIYNSMVGIGMFMKDGGSIASCTFSDISISNIEDTARVNSGIAHQQVPIYIDIDKRTETSTLGTIKQVVFDNITISSDQAILLQGMKNQPIENLTLRNINFNVTRAFSFANRKKPKGFADRKFLYHSDHRLTEFAQKEAYVTVANTKGLVLENIFVHVPQEVQKELPRKVLWKTNTQITNIQNVKLIVEGEAIEKID